METEEIKTTDAPNANFLFFNNSFNSLIEDIILMSKISSIASNFIFFTGIVLITPAQRTTPSRTGTFSTKSSISSSFTKSAIIEKLFAFSSSLIVLFNRSSLRAVTTILAPILEQSMAIPTPRPDEAPVTRIFLFSKEKGLNILQIH